jgi:hypothetical protein
MTDTSKNGIYIDFSSRTVVLIGNDIVDMIIGCMEGEVTQEKIGVAANTLLALNFPDYERGIETWSLGADETTVEYFKQSIGDGFVIENFEADGGQV